ncbi:MAG: hypothetical protein CVU10_03465 [Bacteroidetes bacterium HGW-Bacteroidetes-5]|jgi:energy-coupling factor transporter ATP-binding protein EcfA2|nr:MAG: hypothetical protein CVU10_03465 [Bacteroidetes bacterium HGW-Bacteroidetes-5]
MSSFKLLAIRPLKNCNVKFLRILKEDVLYPFYNGYNFTLKNNEVVVISATEEVAPLNLYNLEITSGNNIEVTISAIVGKNGSGKSSIIELLYAALFNISVEAKLLPLYNDDGEPIEIEEKLRIELFYLIDTNYYQVRIIDENITFSQINSGKQYAFNEQSFNSKEFFYTIAINYSHYALNSDYLGDWVKNIFHKNDGYQTPLVLNPFRKRGIIEINDEEYLTKSRLLSNLISPKSERGAFWINKRRTLIPNKIATDIKFSLDEKKVDKVSMNINEIPVLKRNYNSIIDEIYTHVINKYSQQFKNNINLDFANKYLVVKIFNISERYKPFNQDFRFLEKNKLNRKKLIGLLLKLKSEPSHIAFKFHQAINFIENSDFVVKNIGSWIPLVELNKHINSIQNENRDVINYIPPSFFKYDLKLKSKETLDGLSSGEKQRIFSTSTFKYHLYNLDSVTEEPFKVYENVNIIFDEIELYFHPEFQKTFVSDFLDSLKTLNLKRIKRINCIMVTHSPFILSDIPTSNTLKLDEGKPNFGESNNQTFGANIHDLLANDFFMRNGFMGEWARIRIQSVSEYLSYIINCNDIKSLKIRLDNKIEKDLSAQIKAEIKVIKEKISTYKKSTLKKEDCSSIISIVGEPVLYNALMELYNEAFPNDDKNFIQSQIDKLRKLLKAKV